MSEEFYRLLGTYKNLQRKIQETTSQHAYAAELANEYHRRQEYEARATRFEHAYIELGRKVQETFKDETRSTLETILREKNGGIPLGNWREHDGSYLVNPSVTLCINPKTNTLAFMRLVEHEHEDDVTYHDKEGFLKLVGRKYVKSTDFPYPNEQREKPLIDAETYEQNIVDFLKKAVQRASQQTSVG